MSETPYEVGRWLAEQIKKEDSDRSRLTDGEVLMWAGRAAQPIDKLEVDNSNDGALRIHFKDVGQLVIADSGRSCCESRYMSCDDDLETFVGARVVHIDLAAAAPPDHEERKEDEWGGCHEEMFLKIRTTNGDFTVCAHNEHNGYYGGISPVIKWEDAA